MKKNKVILIALSILMLIYIFSACDNKASVSENKTENISDETIKNTNSINESNTPLEMDEKNESSNIIRKSDNTTQKSIENTPAENSESDNISGELQLGKTDSVILYVGMETGDYAAYCFKNDSDAGRKILGACKDKEQCEINGTIDGESSCEVPGLESDLSASGKILKVNSVKSLGRRK